MNDKITYEVSREFTRFPGGRKRSGGEHSGEQFFEDVTKPLLDSYEFIHFDLSGSAGFSTGFLDEAFGEIGALIGLAEAKRRITITASDDKDAVDTAWRRIAEASKEAGR